MKKLGLTAMAVCLLLLSCNKADNRWKNLYGYSREDIIGEYGFSEVPDAFGSLVESAYCHICEDAKITVTPFMEKSVDFQIECPGENFTRNFRGVPAEVEDDYMINLNGGMTHMGNNRFKSYEVSASVMKDEMNRVRLHGAASVNVWKFENDTIQSIHHGDTILHSSTKYYFDVIK